jgi:hypothetical protein
LRAGGGPKNFLGTLRRVVLGTTVARGESGDRTVAWNIC